MGRDADTCDLLCLDLPKAEAVRHALPPGDELDEWAQAARALGDPTRLAVAWALREAQRACVCDWRGSPGATRSWSPITPAS